jgi:uncharacterized membrane protein
MSTTTLLTLLKLVHISAAIVAVGANVTYAVWLRAAALDRDRIRFVLGTIHLIDRRVANPGYILVLLTGLGMVLTGAYRFGGPGTGWLEVALLLYVVTAVLGFHDFAPAIRAQALEADKDPTSAAYAAAAARTRRLAAITIGIVAVIVCLMVLRPF